MANDMVMIIILVVVIVGIYLYSTGQYKTILNKACSRCGGKKIDKVCPKCPACDLTEPNAQDVIQQLARGCTYRLRGVVRESLATPQDVAEFLQGGDKRVVVVSGLEPELFIRQAMAKDATSLENLRMSAITAAVVNGERKYMVMSASGGQLSPAGAPTSDFSAAFAYLEERARTDVGNQENNLVFYIDESIPCPTPAHEEDDGTTPIMLLNNQPKKEACCGRRH